MNFQKLKSTPIDSSDLRTDQQYMHGICSAAISEIYQHELALLNPCLISLYRWLSTDNRIMRLYVASENSDELQIMAGFVFQVCDNVVYHKV